MSELKSFIVLYDGKFIRAYEEKEADKAIADLEESHKKEVGQLLILNREQANAANRLRDSMEQTLRRQKKKRCLAMADMNWWQANRYSAAEMVERIRWNLEEATKCSKLEEKYLKRYHKWLELAEKFKDKEVK